MFLRSPATKKRDDKRQRRDAFHQILDAEPSDATMKAILENPYLRTEFKSFLSTERGDENIQVIFSIFEVNLI